MKAAFLKIYLFKTVLREQELPPEIFFFFFFPACPYSFRTRPVDSGVFSLDGNQSVWRQYPETHAARRPGP